MSKTSSACLAGHAFPLKFSPKLTLLPIYVFAGAVELPGAVRHQRRAVTRASISAQRPPTKELLSYSLRSPVAIHRESNVERKAFAATMTSIAGVCGVGALGGARQAGSEAGEGATRGRPDMHPTKKQKR